MKQAIRAKSGRPLIIALTAIALMMDGCASFSGIATNAETTPAASLGLKAVKIDWPQEQWWASYHDDILTGLIEKAIAQNPSIRLAQTRLARAQALVEVSRSSTLPRVSLSASSTRQRYSENSIIPPPLAGATVSDNALQINAGYEFDFWGRNRAALDAALSQETAAKAETQAARITLAASVAKTYIQLARLIEQREVGQAVLKDRAQVLALVQQRRDAGVESNVEVRQAEGALPATRVDIAALDEQIALTRHALAALTGASTDSTAALAPRLMVTTGPTLPSSIPLDLVGRRADLVAAKARVEALSRGIDAAKAEFYPNVNLVAFAGFSSIGLSNWFAGGSRTYGIGPAVRLPIFDAGRLRANLKSVSADFDAAVESYNQSLIDAVRDVADQVASLQSLDVQRREQTDAQNAAAAAYSLALQRYKAGLANYLTVLAAQSAVLSQRRAETDLRARSLDLQVGLVKALGGGFNNDGNDVPPVATTSVGAFAK